AGARDVGNVSGDERQAMHLCSGGDQCVDERKRIRRAQASIFFGDVEIHVENPIGLIVDDADQPLFQHDGRSNVAPPDSLDAFSDLADGQNTEELFFVRRSVPPGRDLRIAPWSFTNLGYDVRIDQVPHDRSMSRPKSLTRSKSLSSPTSGICESSSCIDG